MKPSAILALMIWAAPAAWAHEFWLEPQDYTIAPGEAARVEMHVGQNMAGPRSSYNKANFTRFDVTLGNASHPVEGRLGDRPAMDMVLETPGLAIITHVTRAYGLRYDDWDKFVSFVEHKDFDGVLAQHAARGLPKTGFRESYTRFAKSLIAVGNGEGADRHMGLETEIVALANPYRVDVGGGLPVQVFYQGAPRADAQVELFEKDRSGEVSVSLHRTDAEGIAQLPVRPGHSYLVDAVVLRSLEPEDEGGAVWESLWASLTFAVPDEQ